MYKRPQFTLISPKLRWLNSKCEPVRVVEAVRLKVSVYPEGGDESGDELVDGAEEAGARREEVHEVLDAQQRHEDQSRTHRFPARSHNELVSKKDIIIASTRDCARAQAVFTSIFGNFIIS